MTRLYYYVPADMTILPLQNGNVLFRSDNLAVKIEGNSAKFMADHILPLLDGRTPLSVIAEKANIEADELKKHLDNFVDSGVVRVKDHPLGEEQIAANAFSNFLERLHMDPAKTARYLAEKRIVIAGLEAAGGLIAMQLLQAGVKHLTLVDPFPLKEQERSLFPFLKEKRKGRSRQEAFQTYLESVFDDVHIQLGPDALTREDIYAVAEEKDFLVGCFDKGFISAHHWLNQAAMERKIPVIFTELENHISRIGPLVVPGETACFMCYRMRDIACADSFTEAMTYETHLNNQKRPALYTRGFLPSAVPFTAGMIANEIIKYLLTIEASLSSRVLEFNALNLETVKHYVLQKPDCPVCFKKKAWQRTHPTLEELAETTNGESNIYAYKDILISARTGIIKHFDLVPKSPTEPAVPYTIGVTLSNHQFIPAEQRENETCSGKGISVHDATISALGEGVERYSGACFRKEEIRYSTYNEIQEPKLHPEALVLYASGQYEDLAFSPFDANATMGWSAACSLVNSSPVWVPSIAVFMNYPVSSKAESICDGTSNGLAAGATLLHAVLSAALEVIERDAFLIAWYNRLACKRVDPLTHPEKAIVDYCRSYHRRGVEMQLYQLPTDFPVSVFMAVGYQAQGDDGPAVVVGLGADFDPAKAARGALLEIGQIRPALKQRMKTPEARQRLAALTADPSLVNSLDDHSLLYAGRKAVQAFSFLFNQPVAKIEWTSAVTSRYAQLQALVECQKRKQSDLIYYNLTPPDMEGLGLYTARALIPDLQPIHFGEKNIRLGGRRLYNLPVELGLRKTPAAPGELNKNPHPLA